MTVLTITYIWSINNEVLNNKVYEYMQYNNTAKLRNTLKTIMVSAEKSLRPYLSPSQDCLGYASRTVP